MSGGRTIQAPNPRRLSSPASSAPKSPSPSLALSTNRFAPRVSKAWIPVPRRLARHPCDDLDPRTPTHCRHAASVLSRSGLLLSRLARTRQHPRQWSSWRPALAPVAVCLVPWNTSTKTHGTIFHGKRASVELIVRVIACLAEGLASGVRRGCSRSIPIRYSAGLVEAAEQLKAFSATFCASCTSIRSIR